MLDLIIIGGSAAGTSAAIYAARRNLKFKLISTDLGGEVNLSGEINNWPGIISIQGFELAKQFTNHVRHYGTDIHEGIKVESISQKDNYHIIVAKNSDDKKETFKTKSIIVATGIHPRELNLPNEKEMRGKGVTYCTVCDGPLFKGKTTATIGAGNSALESAMMMADISKKVYLVSKYPNNKNNNFGFPRGENIMIDKVKKLKNVEIIYNANTIEIVGENMVSSIKYQDLKTKKEKIINVQGVMVHIGQMPNSDFIDCVKKDQMGQIIVDQKCKTNCNGIFAAGDVTNIPFKQIGIASGQGIISALSAIEYINKWSKT